MKKIFFFIIFMTLHNNSFSTDMVEDHGSKTFNRFGMSILSPSLGFGFHWNIFPLGFYVANQNNQIISFGLDFNLSPSEDMFKIGQILTTESVSDFENLPNRKQRSFGWEIGVHIGYGKMFQSKTKHNLYYGYLFEFSSGYAHNTVHYLPFYLGFSPQFILEIDMFLFAVGVYIDTSMTVTSTTSIGFLLK
ncbi:MAG: hypothetical protein ACRCVW_04945 [Brevinema sp.]